MTKSGIGTQSMNTNTNQSANVSNTSSSGSSTSSLIANAEIPIWVSDKKKWVTGISKKTTINDLIYAILKQCQLLPQLNKSDLNNQFEIIANQYVLIEYTIDNNCDLTQNLDQLNISSQRILVGDTKVYKYLNKWANSQLMSNQQQLHNLNQNLMLKVLQRQTINENSDQEPTMTTSLATKLLKKFGVSSSNTNNQMPNKTVQQSTTNNQVSYRYIDIKLPALTTSQSQPMSTSTSSKQSPNPTRNFDPNTQKSFIYNAIIDKDNKLKQQVKRFQLIDELIKETEKNSKYSNNSILNMNSDSVNNPTYTYSPSQSSSLSSTSSSSNQNQTVPNQVKQQPLTTQQDSKQFNTVDLNDIYCHFPEMCTHHLKEVEDFTVMCSQLFQLEEAIKSQKQVLSSLELDLQRELNQNQFNQQQVVIANAESSETVELRNEVNCSREQTRIQCKQLHDLDLRMRQNETSLMVKEQQLQQLLEELYIQEIYADNALETAITTTPNQTSQQLFLNQMMLNQNNSLNSPQQKLIEVEHEDQLDQRHSELIIKNELPIDDRTNKNYLTKRHVKMFGDSSDDVMINQALMQNTIKINNQMMQQTPVQSQTQFVTNTATLQQKSQSIGNLSKCLPSPPQIPPTVSVSNQTTMNTMKMSKSNHFINTTNLNVNSDHSGDNDSGISSMSSETTTNQNCLINTNSTPPPYLHQQQQQQQRQLMQNQYNQYQQFQQVYRQPQQQAMISPAGKSVLETLV